jgi:hypothetical protein
MVLQAARSLTSSEVGSRARHSHATFRRAVWHLEPIDWIMLGAVSLTVLAALGIGLLSGRLAPSSVLPSAPPTPSSAIVLPVGSQAAVGPTIMPAVTATPAARAVYLVSADGARARLRAEPSLRAAIVERLVDGTSVTELGGPVTEAGRTWRQIESPSGRSGWIDATLVRPSGAPPQRSPTPPTLGR